MLPRYRWCDAQANEAAVVNRTATRIICVSQGVADVLAAQHVAENRLRVVYNAIDSRIALPTPVELPPMTKDLIIGTVGTLLGTQVLLEGHTLRRVAAGDTARLGPFTVTAVEAALGRLPGVNGDEAWYGVQVLRLLSGEAVDWRTPTGKCEAEGTCVPYSQWVKDYIAILGQ